MAQHNGAPLTASVPAMLAQAQPRWVRDTNIQCSDAWKNSTTLNACIEDLWFEAVKPMPELQVARALCRPRGESEKISPCQNLRWPQLCAVWIQGLAAYGSFSWSCRKPMEVPDCKLMPLINPCAASLWQGSAAGWHPCLQWEPHRLAGNAELIWAG